MAISTERLGPDSAQIFPIASSTDTVWKTEMFSAITSLIRFPLSISSPLVALTTIVSGAISAT